jgi:hypothetical protein
MNPRSEGAAERRAKVLEFARSPFFVPKSSSLGTNVLVRKFLLLKPQGAGS